MGRNPPTKQMTPSCYIIDKHIHHTDDRKQNNSQQQHHNTHILTQSLILTYSLRSAMSFVTMSIFDKFTIALKKALFCFLVSLSIGLISPYLLTYSLTQSINQSLTQSLTHTHSLTYSLTYSLNSTFCNRCEIIWQVVKIIQIFSFDTERQGQSLTDTAHAHTHTHTHTYIYTHTYI